MTGRNVLPDDGPIDTGFHFFEEQAVCERLSARGRDFVTMSAMIGLERVFDLSSPSRATYFSQYYESLRQRLEGSEVQQLLDSLRSECSADKVVYDCMVADHKEIQAFRTHWPSRVEGGVAGALCVSVVDKTCIRDAEVLL